MAVDYFLKLEGIPGESQDKAHKDEIHLLNWNWGETNSGTHGAAGGGGGAGKVSMQDFIFSMHVNKASPKLFLACANGEHIKTGTLVCRKAGKEQQEYLKIKFTDLLVSSYQTGGSTSQEVPVDQISLNFANIEISYAPQNADGKLGAPIVHKYNVQQNTGS